jgi:hypothetical protein
MHRESDERLSSELAREVCLRTGSKAMIGGSVASLGSEYAHRSDGSKLPKRRCDSPGASARESKGRRTDRLDRATADLRGKLGNPWVRFREPIGISITS